MVLSRTDVFAIDIILSLLATFAVIARFWVRKLRKSRYGADDWTILGSLMLMWAMSAIILRGAATSAFASRVSRDPKTHRAIYDKKVKRTLQFHMTVWIFTIVLVGLVKISVVLLYRRLFRVKKGFRIYSVFLMVVLSIWTVSFLFARVLQCGPKMSIIWTFSANRAKLCKAADPISNGFMISDVITDLIVVLSPIPVIWGMHLPRLQKFAVFGIFGMGFLSTSTGVVRAYILLDINYNIQPRMMDNDIIVVDTKIAVLSIAEISSAIIAACLPTLRPLVIGEYPCNLVTKVRSSFSSSLSSMRRSSLRRGSKLSISVNKVTVSELGSPQLRLNFIQVQELERVATRDRVSPV
ncbi:hypothetical protein DM02DRAFT_674116 [Periconia macrospinosa]|uniref:Rhodopsin domain-containing protein n=1 Tax=Periconia macrospinosa TaxID=97972 RepID=A0A2V1DIP9_9PLEO|nr:hypothetical protein DM02DRAFT_674116 [Periconia macrospinosa]